MSSQAYAERLSHALAQTGMVEPVRSNFSDGRINVLLRLKSGVDRSWNTLITSMLLATDHFSKQAHAWGMHICRVYFLREKQLVFGWSIVVTSLDMTHSLDELVRVMNGGDPEPSTEVDGESTEFPLVGATLERNAPGKSGKGAHTIGGRQDFRPPVRR